FSEFMRKVTRKSPGEDETGHGSVSGDAGMIVVGAPRTGSSDPEEIARYELTTLLLRRKLGGADPVEWLAAGFARATAHRATKTSKAVASPRAYFKDLWNENLPANAK